MYQIIFFVSEFLPLLFSADLSGFRIIRSMTTLIPTHSPKTRKSPPSLRCQIQSNSTVVIVSDSGASVTFSPSCSLFFSSLPSIHFPQNHHPQTRK
ncbi:Phototropin-1 [Fusarium oxysporum f. sp. albedinis]|nr:Phototropin-1 [Fusarium oxysporum f. sp. albedinis]